MNPLQEEIKANLAFRNEMFLNLRLIELTTNDSTGPEYLTEIDEDTLQMYDSRIHEACEHVPISVVYDDEQEKIDNLREVKRVVEITNAEAYTKGTPIHAIPHNEGTQDLVACFPVQFYRFKRP